MCAWPDDRYELEDDEELEAYVDAYEAYELPDPDARARVWEGIEAKTRTRRWPWAAGLGLAAAAASLLLVSGGRRSVVSEGSLEAMQSGYARASAEPRDAKAMPADSRSAKARPESSAPDPTPSPLPDDTSTEDDASAIDETSEASEASDDAPSGDRHESRRAKRPRPPTDDASAVAEETALFAEIRSALTSGRAADALDAIARHQQRFPRGIFRLEAKVAKAQALCALGRTAQAIEIRDAFLRRHPTSHLANRMRDVCR